jgi:hypothetical protein
MLSYTLVPDGPSDRALIPILDWLIEQHWHSDYQSQFVENDYLPRLADGLERRINQALHLFPCDLLFVHRDAEAQSPAARLAEITGATHGVATPWVPVIPVRMTEAWLLSDPNAIRAAADNPSGKHPLHLPRKRADRLPDPKRVLVDALEVASGLSPRRLARFRGLSRRSRVAELTSDFSALRALPTFCDLENYLRDALGALRLQ